MSALSKVVRAGVSRRWLRTLVITVTALVAVAAGVLGAGLLVASNAPFDQGFTRQNGAHLVAELDAGTVTAAELAATAQLDQVSAAAGPYPLLTVTPTVPATTDHPVGFELQPITVVGRDDSTGPVDDLTLVSGRWPTGPGEIVLATGGAVPTELAALQFATAPGAPVLTVVGVATSVSQTADAWVLPDQLHALTPTGVAGTSQMLYRLTDADTDTEVAAGTAAIASALPPGSLTGSRSWLAVKQVQAANIEVFVPFVVAFAVLGLVLSVLIIVTVVSGAVGAARHRIGVLKAVGFTPSQVTRAYATQALIPAGLGVLLGAVLGNLLAIPVLRTAETSYQTTGLGIPMWVDLLVPLAALCVVAVAAIVPALRAGRLRAAQAITLGRTPAIRRGRRAQRAAGALPLPRSVSLGLANPFARPSRTALTAATIVFATTAITLAAGLAISLTGVQSSRTLDADTQVSVTTGGPPQLDSGAIHMPAPGNKPTPPADAEAVADVVADQPGTAAWYGTRREQAAVQGVAGLTPLIGYQGDSAGAAARMVAGQWLHGPGQAVVTGRFLTAAGASIGDTLTITNGDSSVDVQIVGEAFFLTDDGMSVLTDMADLAALGFDATPREFHVVLEAGTDLDDYLRDLRTALPAGAWASDNQTGGSDVIVGMNALIALLTLLLVVAAGLGVLNSVLLDTRERAHDLGVVKALGMTPRQVMAMVLSSVALVGAASAAIGVPLGVALHHVLVPRMVGVTGARLPAGDIAVYAPALTALLFLGGVAIAIAGGLAPAGWAAAGRPVTSLRTE